MGVEKAFSRVTIHDFIANVKALREKEVVSVCSSIAVKDTLDVLTSRNYLSCPVQDSERKEWIGFVDMMDIMAWVIDGCVQRHMDAESKQSTWHVNTSRLTARASELLTKDTRSIINSSQCDPFHPIDDTSSMYDLVKALTTVHRVPVRDASKAVKHIITQSAMIQFLNANIAVLGALAHTPLRELGYGPDASRPEIISISESDPAIVGFHMIQANRISAVAVVNAAGEYVATLSVSDLKGLTPEDFPTLLKPCRTYLEDRHGGPLPHMMCCTTATTLQEAVNLLAAWHVHRLWIIDPHARPVAALTLSSVIRMLV